MFFSAIQLFLFLIFPAIAIWLNKRYKFISILSPVILCYIFGIILRNFSPFPINTNLSQGMTEGTVLLAIPMLLFSTDFMKWLRLAKKTMLSFLLAIIGVLVASTLMTFLFASHLPHAGKIAGMMVGVYTGGTPNMNAIGLALKVPNEIFIMLNGIDFVLGGLYLLILLSVLKSFLGFFLPPFQYSTDEDGVNSDTRTKKSEQPTFWTIEQMKIQAKESSIAIALSFIVTLAAVGMSLILLQRLDVTVIILLITTFGIAFSFVDKIRELKGSYPTGQYMLLLFCVAIGSMANLEDIVKHSGILFGFVASIMFTSIFIHFTLAALFKIDRDTVIITHTAGIYGPAFVGPVAEMLGNREILVSGLTTGLVGYAIGNYAGIGLSYFLKYFWHLF